MLPQDANADGVSIHSLNLDILPSDCPNPFRVNLLSTGRLPMAILGSATFDVSTIDVNTISINAPYSGQDSATKM